MLAAFNFLIIYHSSFKLARISRACDSLWKKKSNFITFVYSMDLINFRQIRIHKCKKKKKKEEKKLLDIVNFIMHNIR